MKRQAQVNTTHIKTRSEENENKCSLFQMLCVQVSNLISAQPTNTVDAIKQRCRFILYKWKAVDRSEQH